MRNNKKLILVFAVIVTGMFPVYSQWTEEDIEAMLIKMVEVENPVRMPVLGIGTGYFNYYGNVNDAFRSYTLGQPGLRLNVSMFLTKETKKQLVRANMVFMTGNLTGTQRYVPKEPDDDAWLKNLNFKSNIYSFGVNFHYSFKPWIKGKFFEPFISAGIETLQFDTKANYYLNNDLNKPYYYWTDGTIRDGSEITNKDNAKIISRDYKYETDLRRDNKSGLGNYGQFTVAVPVDIGIDFNISYRVTLRAATSLHYAFTDLIDDKSSKAKNDDLPDYKGKKGNNMFTFSYLSLHLDLFSSRKLVKEYLNTVEIEDEDLEMKYNDQDGDGVPDWWDECPDTPPNVPVDDAGCPFDTDGDGVPDYLDREPNSRPGAIVDEWGVEITENTVVELLNADAIRRSDVETYLMMHKMQNRARRGQALPIPDKFKGLDSNGDGYISFDEILKTINDFFDGNSNFSPDEIEELNNFFFDQ